MGRLERHLDLDLIARVQAGIKVRPEPLKRVIAPKPGDDYRAARRNDARGLVWQGVRARYVPVFSRSRTYKPNGHREVCRRLRQAHLRALKQQKALAA
jgi:hypothetical protein